MTSFPRIEDTDTLRTAHIPLIGSDELVFQDGKVHPLGSNLSSRLDNFLGA